MTTRKITVEQVDGAGRVFRALAEIEAGETVLEDEAFVAGLWDEGVCLVCHVEHTPKRCPKVISLFGKKLATKIPAAESVLVEIDEIGELDRARTVLLALGMEKTKVQSTFQDMSVAKTDQALAAAKTAAKDVTIQSFLNLRGNSVQDLARMIGVLNTNCHTLETVGGSALFPQACICEHSCAPNCNYSSDGSKIRVVAVQSIRPGERISIDYMNMFYEPTGERQRALQNSYAFRCECNKCSGLVPDKCRAFKCPNGEDHIVSAFGGEDTMVFKCLSCEFVADEKQAQAFISAERALVQMEGEEDGEAEESMEVSEEQVEQAESLIRKEHFVNFLPLAEEAHEEASGSIDPEATVAKWASVIECIDYCLPEYHHERILHYDKYGQVLFRFGDREAAKVAFAKALAISTVCEGLESSLTKQLRHLVENMPSTIDGLVAHYQRWNQV